MADPIKLPPLPKHTMLGLDQYGSPSKYGWSADQLRARDLEVARVVLEAAANVCENPGPYWDWDDFTNAIRALEVSHAE